MTVIKHMLIESLFTAAIWFVTILTACLFYAIADYLRSWRLRRQVKRFIRNHEKQVHEAEGTA